ncbi:MAG: hypothetical protein ACRD18_08900 [Terriglobia bacterium]
MSPETLNQIRAANSGLARFLGQASRLLAAGSGAAFAEIQDQMLTLDSMIASIGRSLGSSGSRGGLDADSQAQVDLYVANLEQLKTFLTQLQTYAEARRDHLRSQARNLAESLDWCKTMKITMPE